MKTPANDQFERYYSEKLWEMIPPVYRDEDGRDENPEKGVLRSIIEVMAGQAAILRRSQDRLWDDQFVDLCDSWAVPYIAGLLGTRTLSDQNTRGMRADAAKTIYYRRRIGTPRVLEEIISDITGWEGKIVENFQRLARARHGLDPRPQLLAGRFSGTPRGGWADLRHPLASEVAGGPFDEFFHTPDFRQHRGHRGRYNIPKLAIHLFRLIAYYVPDSTPFMHGDGQRFTFDPSGRNIPLFSKRKRPEDWDEWHSALEWELPAPIRCRLLGHAEYLISEAALQSLNENTGISDGAINDLSGFTVRQFRDEQQLRALVATLPSQVELLAPGMLTSLLRYFIKNDCGKQVLLPNALVKDEHGHTKPEHGSICVELPAPDNIITADRIVAANLNNWAPVSPAFMDRVFGNPIQRILAIDPGHGRFLFSANRGNNLACSYYYGFSGPVGAGTYDRRYVMRSRPTVLPVRAGGGPLTALHLTMNGISQIGDSKSYTPVANRLMIQNMTLQSADKQRPYIGLAGDWLLDAGTHTNSSLCLDGLWIGSMPTLPGNVILRGDYDCVTIRSCTLDPGGDVNILGQTIHPVPVVIEGHVNTLVIESSITGPLIVRGLLGLVENVCIRNSIMQSADKVINIKSGLVNIERSTIIGEVAVHRIEASESIFFCQAPYYDINTGEPKIAVADTQAGCFRFSAAPLGSRLPQPYEPYLYPDSTERWFTSLRFGDPGYCQLGNTAPEEISRGAENGLELGAFNSLINPVKLDDLKTKIEEYMPFGLVPIFIHET